MLKHIIVLVFSLFVVLFMNGCNSDDGASSIQSTATSFNVEIVKSVINDDSIEIIWELHSDALSYEVHWGVDADSLENIESFEADTVRFIHTDIEADTTYYYKLVMLTEETQISSAVVAIKSSSTTKLRQSDAAI
jgi:REP element-mobilizing transposase RayT